MKWIQFYFQFKNCCQYCIRWIQYCLKCQCKTTSKCTWNNALFRGRMYSSIVCIHQKRWITFLGGFFVNTQFNLTHFKLFALFSHFSLSLSLVLFVVLLATFFSVHTIHYTMHAHCTHVRWNSFQFQSNVLGVLVCVLYVCGFTSICMPHRVVNSTPLAQNGEE